MKLGKKWASRLLLRKAVFKTRLSIRSPRRHLPRLPLFIILALSVCAVFLPQPAAQAGEKRNSKQEDKFRMVPEWVSRTPIFQDKICSVGTCEPTLFPEDAKPCAADSARADLAKTVAVHVESIMLDENRHGDSSVDKATVSSVRATTTNTVIRNAVIEEYWYDAEGKASYTKGITYALACIPKSKLPFKD